MEIFGIIRLNPEAPVKSTESFCGLTPISGGFSMNKTLSSDIELFAAALSQVTVSVNQRTADDIPVFLDCGIIRRYSPYSVLINGNHYVREETEFRIE
jgi:hypothetical protein